MPNRGSTIFKHGRARQRGAVLLIILVILLVGIAAVLINSLTASAAKNARQAKTAAVLAQAKDALIGFAVTYGDTHTSPPQVHGYLPCPDTNGSPEGSADPPCLGTNVSVIGRLPWVTLDLSPLRDGDGECLWYAVSGTYKDNPKTGLMNWDTDGQLQAYGADGTLLTPVGNQVVAVIFAPSAPLSGQDRSGTTAPICGGNYTASNYLDSGTVNSIAFNNADVATGKFIQGTSGASINDQMVFITRQDIWNAVQKRTDFQNTLKSLAQQVALCLVHYGNSNNSCGFSCTNDSLPWPALVGLSSPVAPGRDFADETQYNDHANLYAGRVPYDVGTSAGFHNPLTTLMNTASCGSGWTTSVDVWWSNWKDQLFYALANDFHPINGGGQGCGFSHICLNINGGSHVYAGVVMFANSRLAGQTRASDTTGANSSPRANVSNYLEDVSTGVGNASNFAGATGGENYRTQTVGPPPINDVLCTIDRNLVVNCP